MAVTTVHAAEAGKKSVFAIVADWAGNLLVRLGEFSEGARAARHAAALSQLSDQRLAAMGIKREDIVQHAFAHLRQG